MQIEPRSQPNNEIAESMKVIAANVTLQAEDVTV